MTTKLCAIVTETEGTIGGNIVSSQDTGKSKSEGEKVNLDWVNITKLPELDGDKRDIRRNAKVLNLINIWSHTSTSNRRIS